MVLNMNNNKKGNMFYLWFLIIIFNIFIALGFTFIVGFNNLAGSEIVDPIHGSVKDISEERTSTEIQDYIDDSRQAYYDNTIPFDLIIFGLIINFYFFLIYSAVQSRKESTFALFSLITFGMIFMLFLLGISIDIQEWILTQIYEPVFSDYEYTTPIMDWYFANVGIINLFLMILLLLINQFDKLKAKVGLAEDRDN